jgi:hypothetical protein
MNVHIVDLWSEGDQVFRPNKPAWHDLAECHGRHHLFFSDRRDDIIEAKQLCQYCPVRQTCLDYAIAGDEHGIWGGLTTMERQRYVQARSHK